MNKVKRVFGRSGRLIILLLLIVSTFSYAMFQGGFVSWFVFYTISPFLLYSLLFAFAPIRIVDFKREITPAKLHRGDSAQVTISFQNKSLFPFVFLSVRELGENISKVDYKKERPNQIFFVGWKRKFEWTYELPQVERGVIQFRGLQLTFSDFFGWSIRYKFLEENRNVLVYPKLTEMKYKPFQMQFEHGGVLSPFSMIKDTSLVTGIRDYQPGDKYSWIHWKSFAKNETLRTKEFEDRQTQDIFITIDQTMDKNFEYAVDLTASILHSVVKNHGDISFLATGEKRHYFPKIKTQSQLEKVFQHLAIIQPNTKLSFESIMVNEIGLLNSATLIIVTGELTDQLKQFFIKGSKMNQGIVCFVVTDTDTQQTRTTISNAKVVPISKDNIENVFTEVMKP
ncbi:DUF58 domain-containing protein [Lysinibacillus sp. BW-2-10]|uniref:DUF58 domain-containing protein n=1 Tax=Lysinibacillus sp. BW-2-10 TaxID=2590030 RepID=UPI001180781C|nr:DUF58 domain-containing protein [Lysinibacillus sp. BW-2-10]TSI04473.1 DUF58 domain-containing protein [Lysinibacillus sp. BW-2-10]